MSQRITVNIYGGPGCGKSTTAALVFGLLKVHEVNCELVTEFAKDLTWEERHKTLNNQLYILGKQYHRIWRIPDEIESVVTDSPIIFTAIYSNDEVIKSAAMYYFKQQNNFNFFLDRVKKYNPSGRNQTEEEAKIIDQLNKDLLKKEKIPYTIVPGNHIGANMIVQLILSRFNKTPIITLQKNKIPG